MNTDTDTDPNALYQALDDKLLKLDISLSAAELHGILTGFVCTGLADSELQLILKPFEFHTPEQLALAEGLFAMVVRDLSQNDFHFNLFLPRDEAELAARIEATANWSNGFIQGLLHRQRDLNDFDSKTIRECLDDLISISQLSADEETLATPANESLMQLHEVEEYLKINVQLIYEELINNPDSPIE